jgi:hypothetical protein
MASSRTGSPRQADIRQSAFRQRLHFLAFPYLNPLPALAGANNIAKRRVEVVALRYAKGLFFV